MTKLSSTLEAVGFIARGVSSQSFFVREKKKNGSEKKEGEKCKKERFIVCIPRPLSRCSDMRLHKASPVIT